jgi:phospholipase/carboxylesterase
MKRPGDLVITGHHALAFRALEPAPAAPLCGRILPELEPALASRDAVATLDALILHDRADAWLQRPGVPHRLQLHDAGHELTASMQADVLDWFGAGQRRRNR